MPKILVNGNDASRYPNVRDTSGVSPTEVADIIGDALQIAGLISIVTETGVPETISISSALTMQGDSALYLGPGVTLRAATGYSGVLIQATDVSNVKVFGEGVIVCTTASAPSFTNVSGLTVDVRIEDSDALTVPLVTTGSSAPNKTRVGVWRRAANTVALLGDSLTLLNNSSFTPTSFVRSGNVVTCTTSGHPFGNQARGSIFGIAPESFNGYDKTITRIDSNTFSYESVGDDGSATVGGAARVISNVKMSNIGYFTYANGKLGAALRLVRNCGFSTRETSFIKDKAQDAIDSGAAWCIVMAGTNDVIAATASATTIDNLKSIYAALNASGMRIVACTIPPFGAGYASQATANPLLITVNEWIRQYVASQDGMILADVHAAVVSPTSATGDAKTNALQSDDIHWNPYGAYLAGVAIADAMRPHIQARAVLTASASDTYDVDATNPNIWPNAPFDATATGASAGGITGDVAAGWEVIESGGGTGTASIAARSDGYGYDQVCVFDPSANADFLNFAEQTSLHARVVAGERYVLRAHVVLTGVVASQMSNLRNRIQCVIGGTTHILGSCIENTITAAASTNTDLDLVLESPVFTIPPGTITAFQVDWFATFTGNGTALTMAVGRQSLVRQTSDV